LYAEFQREYLVRLSKRKRRMCMVEHVVLFKVKDGVAPSETDTMLKRIRSLASLEHLLQPTVGPLLRIRTTTSFDFTLFYHARFKSKHDLHAYATHPTHLAVIEANSPLVENTMALDWVPEVPGGAVLPAGSALRVTFLKLKQDGGDGVKEEILGAIREIQRELKEAIEVSCGENFSAGRANGFSIASLEVFPGLSELEEADSNEEIGLYEKNDKIAKHLERVMVLYYVVP